MTVSRPLTIPLDVLGVRVDLRFAAREVELIAAAAVLPWLAGASSVPERRGLSLDVDMASRASLPAPGPAVRIEGRTVTIQTGAGWGVADQCRKRGQAWLDRASASSPEETALLLETLAIYLAQSAARPVVLHAAALSWRSRIVLVAGDEGAGKSTLSYACLREGFDLMAEDACFAAAASPPFRVWSNPWRLHLLPDATRHFPELRGAPVVRMLNGETKLSVRVPPGQSLKCGEPCGVALLRRTELGSSLAPLDSREALAKALVLRGGPDRTHSLAEEAARNLSTGPAALLDFGPDIYRAVSLLRRWAEGL